MNRKFTSEGIKKVSTVIIERQNLKNIFSKSPTEHVGHSIFVESWMNLPKNINF
jgi:hypothetical protein